MMLDHRIAVVTGANRGLGKEVALRFSEEGAKVILVGRNADAANAVKQLIEEKGGMAEVFAADVTNPDSVNDIAAQIEQKYGRVDILINNAGISIERPLNDMAIDVWKQIIDTNLNSVAIVTKAFLPMMIRQQSGNIVNVGSGAGLRGLPGSCAYSASKAGVICLSQALGDELRNFGIRVNVICPGPIDTELFQQSERREYLLKSGSDIFSPKSVANSILFLASDMSGGMNSQVLTMRGINRW
ncbi:MAG: SDR family oxidoreductase [Angelakisella sp.]|nr:SDR family oxidoreductase [Angelakisella sp.]